MNHETLRALALAALAWHEGDKEGHEKHRQAKRALRRETHPEAIIALLDEIDALRARVAELEKDAARYRWWVKAMTSENAMEVLGEAFGHLPHDTVPTESQFSEVVDAAIDAAMNDIEGHPV